MISINAIMILGSVLVILAILSSRLSARVGVPALVVWVAIGMLAGSEGLGGLQFENYALANSIGTVALAFILFDGGLRTSRASLRAAWKPAFLLATLGVAITALATGLAAHLILRIPLVYGILLGSIVGSTDAAAVFAVLRSKGVRLHPNLTALLEVESGSNDPMAVFLTIALIEVALGRIDPGLGIARLFVLQMGVGLTAGLVVGWIGVQINNRMKLDEAGLYPIMIAAVGLLSFGIAAILGGSGFLSVYVAGMVVGNRPMIFRRGIELFIDGTAWLAQIVMFTMLGLLTFPSRLLQAAPAGLAVAAVLIFLARPVAVIPLLLPFRFSARETLVVIWGGLKGAVPIILATFPLLSGVQEGRVLFDVVFFVVLISATTQGWTLPLVARWLGLQLPLQPGSALSLEITSLQDVKGDIVEYMIPEDSRLRGRRIRDLALPDGAVIAMLARGQEMIPPRGSTELQAGDHAFVVVRPEVRNLVDRAFSGIGFAGGPALPPMEFSLPGHMRVEHLEEFYGIRVDAQPGLTLAELLGSRLGREGLRVGSALRLGEILLTIRETSLQGVERVSLRIMEPE
ncbi:MAG: potassium/proton antiporter [Candidatus Eisenbacteria bacterium]|nr:potassium/proton antiporter [Candidatus Eisenbacteria bacterium]